MTTKKHEDRNAEPEKNLKYYMELPWTYIIQPDYDEVRGRYFQAEVLELDGCFTNGADYADAWESLQEALRGYLEVKLQFGDPIPEPVPNEKNYSGKFVVRVPKSLHKYLDTMADAEGVSLNAYCAYKLAKP